MATSIVKCDYCGDSFEKENPAINRAKREDKNIYCNRKCSGLGRRINKTLKQKVSEKQEYDMQYRAKNKESLREKKALYGRSKAGKATQKRARIKGKAYHAKYIQSDRYVEWKKEYDRTYRAKKDYGEFWECQILRLEIEEEVEKTQSDYEVRLENQTLNKSQKRKREHERINCN